MTTKRKFGDTSNFSRADYIHKQNFKDIFDLVANNKDKTKLINGKPDGLIDRDQFAEILKLINYQTNDFDKLADKLFTDYERINFAQFLRILDVKIDDYTRQQEQNAFALLAGENNELIKLDTVLSILDEQGMSHEDLLFFEEQILQNKKVCDKKTRMVNFTKFLTALQKKGYKN